MTGTVLAGALAAGPALAEDWTGAISADWATAGNWSPAVTPTNATNVNINGDQAVPATVTAAGAAASQVSLGTAAGQTGVLVVDGGGLSANFLLLGDNGTGTLTVKNGGVAAGAITAIANNSGSTGTVTITGAGSQLNASAFMDVGSSGTGTLDVLAGGTSTVGVLNLGHDVGAIGHMLISGAGSQVTAGGTNIGATTGGTGDLQVSSGGTLSGGSVSVGASVDAKGGGHGTLTVDTASTLKASQLSVGDAGQGTATLTDVGTTATVTGGVNVGVGATGTLTIANGATATSASGALGVAAVGSGTVTVTGAGSAWADSGALTVGQLGKGTLDVFAGGHVSADHLTGSDSATISVDGSGSQLALTHALVFGATGAANTLGVTGGATMTSGDATIAAGTGANAAVTVSGTGSSWNPANLNIGGAGTSSVTLANAATMTDPGNLQVDGTGTSKLTVSSGASLTQGLGPVGNNAGTGNFTVGETGTGILRVDSGGVLSTRFSLLGDAAGANGSATVTGAGSSWTIRAGGSFGFQGTGSLSVLNGGLVSFTGVSGAFLGFSAGSSGTVLVSDAGSKMQVAASLTVGLSGTGVMTVQSGGAVQVTASTTVGSSSITGNVPGTGTLTVTGAGSTLATKGFTIGGSGGTGTANVLAGGVITSTTASSIAAGATINGVEQDGNGTMTVGGAGSAVTISNTLDIGARGHGSLTIQAGGSVSDTQGYIGSFKNPNSSLGVGVVTVTGAGSLWTNSSFVRVGDQGNGSLSVLAGAGVVDQTGFVGFSASGIGAATVDGTGSSWTSSGNVAVGQSGSGTLTLSNGGGLFAGGAAGTGVLNIGVLASSTGVLNIGAAQASAAAAAGTVHASQVVFGAGTGSIVFNHTASNYVFAPVISGAGSVKVLAGTTILGGAETYTGATTVSGGTLLVNGSVASPTVSVASGGTLGGTGTLSGATTVADGGTLIGQAGSVLTFGALTLNNNSNINVALGAPSTAALFQVNGALTLDGQLNITSPGGFGAGLYRLFNYAGALTDNGLAVASSPAGTPANSLSVQTSVAGQVNLIYGAAAALQFWNGSTLAPTGAVVGGSGTWKVGPTNWTDAAGDASGPWTGIFGIFAGTGGAVTIDNSGGAVTATGLQFAADGYSVGGGTLTLTGPAPTIRVGDGTAAGAGYTATVSAPIAGSGGLIKTDLGTLVLSGANSFTGGVDIQGGVLSVSADANLGAASGGVTLDGGTLAATASFASARGVSVLAGGGAINTGSGVVLDLSGPLSGSGAFAKLGAGTLKLSGAGGYNGAASVAAGTLQVNGTLGGTMQVQSGGRLQGIGTVGATTVAAGGVLAPGNSIGTLTVAGNLTFAAGSTYEVELNAAGQSDLTHATGAIAINGGSVHALAAGGAYTLGTRYTVLAADGGLSGAFGGVSLATALSQPFLTFGLAYDASHAYLDVVRSSVSFCSVAATANQCAAGNGAEGLGAASGVYVALANLPDAASARAAFDSLSGEIYAANRGAQVEDSRFVRDAALGRLDAGGEGRVAWGQAFGDWGSVNADGDAARISTRVGGFFTGVDGPVGDHGRLGVLAGFTQSRVAADARASVAISNNYHLGVYAGLGGGTGFRGALGGAFAWRDAVVTRSVAFSGFADALRGRANGGTGQVFGEVAYRFGGEDRMLEPYAGAAYVTVRQNAFGEAGGAAALGGAGGSTNVAIASLGLRGAATWSPSEGTIITLRGGLGWRNASGDITPMQTLAFRSAGAAFTVDGAPIARNALALNADLGVKVGARTRLSLTYDGQIADTARDHSLKVGLTVGF